MRKHQKWLGLAAVFALLFSTALSLTSSAFYYSGYVSSFLGFTADIKEVDEKSNYYPSAYGELNAENSEKLIADEKAHNIQAMHEGAVMLKNDNGTLPLAADERSVTFFGNSVKDPIYKTNAGQANFNPQRGGKLYDAFEAAGFRINPTMREAYDNSGVDRVSSTTPGVSDIGEVPLSFYTQELRDSYSSDYNDVAIVMFSRYAGEGVDLDPYGDVDGVPMLSLHPEEADLLKMIKESGKFGKTVVLINSSFAMDMQWIEDEQYGVDACIVFGAVGDYGFIGLTDILTGTADISGHLADTWAASSLSSAAMQNFGDYTYANINDESRMSKYLIYAEGIYVGYKYYETRYQDQVLGINNAAGSAGAFMGETWDYADEMAYPFGYGLSYASFTQELKSVVWDHNSHEVTVTVEVTNNGGYEGKSKDLVQLYVQLPWEKGQVEKSAIQLIGFQKTGELASGESETVTITVSDYYFASYDDKATNGADASKTGCYVLDAGDYWFAIGEDSHDALNNVLAARGVSGMFDEKGTAVDGDATKAVKSVLDTYDNVTWAVSPMTGEVVYNHLQDLDLNYYKPGEVEYLTRADWNTFPKSYTDVTATEEMKTLLVGDTYTMPSDAPDPTTLTFNEDAGLTLVEMRDVPYDSELWDTFINQLSINDLATICGDNRGSVAIPDVGKPANAYTNGPNGIQGSYNQGNGEGCTLYVDEVILASTFNLDLSRDRGLFFGEDALYAGFTMVFGPGANIHRSAYLGRCSEYYSEDGLLSYLMSYEHGKAMTEMGVISGFKHMALNDQEMNRMGVSTFVTEQAAREIYFKAFEGALMDGAGLGVMTSYNRFGITSSTAHYGAMVDILRNEWGFKGINLTDSCKGCHDYMLTAESIVGGTDQFLSDTLRTSELSNMVIKDKDGNILNWMKTANKHFYYAHSRSFLINGLTEEVVIEETVFWWQPALIGVCAVIGIGCAAMLGVYIWKVYFKKEGK